MADPEHLKILKQGVEAWNAWRGRHRGVLPDLIGADLTRAELRNAHLSGADLRGARLEHADLRESYLTRADLRGANLTGARLSVASLSSAGLSDARLSSADLSNARLDNTFLAGADLDSADLTGADLERAELYGARLSHARLTCADLTYAALIDADLSHADLQFTDLTIAGLRGADFTAAYVGGTLFVGNDLRQVKGLEAVKHQAPSNVDIDTIYKSKGDIPELFLRGCGLPEDFIAYVRSLAGKGIEFYSCFISYSSREQEFADRLHADLQAKGVRVWFAPHDMKIGARIRPTIDESIRVYDKLLLVLSESSVGSQWVEQEVETALAREREQEGRTVLFPIRIDDAVMGIKTGWPALLKNTRHVGDFTRWKEHGPYQRALERLLRDLKAGA